MIANDRPVTTTLLVTEGVLVFSAVVTLSHGRSRWGRGLTRPHAVLAATFASMRPFTAKPLSRLEDARA